MKSTRQEKILEIISNENIETQEELIEALKREGFAATQATASRDIRQLKLLKVMVDGVYKYVAPKKELNGISEYNSALISSIREIKYALNNVVIKTAPGLAQAVAAGIDSLQEEEIQINLNNAGFKNGTVRFYDAYNDEQLDIEIKNGVMRVPMKASSYRLLIMG